MEFYLIINGKNKYLLLILNTKKFPSDSLIAILEKNLGLGFISTVDLVPSQDNNVLMFILIDDSDDAGNRKRIKGNGDSEADEKQSNQEKITDLSCLEHEDHLLSNYFFTFLNKKKLFT